MATAPWPSPGTSRGSPSVTAMNSKHPKKFSPFRLWLVSLLLIIPACAPYFAHYLLNKQASIPTGFIIDDMAYYMANAREHYDTGKFQIMYGNPFSYSYDTPPIYFQPLILFLGTIWQFTNLDPGLIYVAFGLLAAWLCARIALGLYQEIVGLKTWRHWLGLVIFFWGGGLLALAGLIRFVITKGAVQKVFALDPGGGFWFLNFGRNLVFPTEAFYHALFFACILYLGRKRFVVGAILAFLLSISHPFTGLELLAILMAWAFLEVCFMKSGDVPPFFFFACLGLLALHLGYYLIYLNLFAEHRHLMSQWMLPWTLRAKTIIPAYILVGSLTLWTVRRFSLAREFFTSSRNRLLLVWFLVAFALANHEKVLPISPVQPLHFTRGYIWVPLFFMGVSSLLALFSFAMSRASRFSRTIFLGGIVLVFLSDNALWLGSFPLQALGGQAPGISVTRDQQLLLTWLNSAGNKGAVLLSQDPLIGYLATVYTPLRSWVSHPFNTPEIALRQKELDALLDEGRWVDSWDTMSLLIIYCAPSIPANRPPWLEDRKAVNVFQNPTYSVFRVH
jgi:hypothetical protein